MKTISLGRISLLSVFLVAFLVPARLLCQTLPPPAYGDGGLAISAKLSGPLAVAINAAGDVYIADTGHDRIRKVTRATGIISTLRYKQESAGLLSNAGWEIHSPHGLAFDKAGNLYIMETLDTGNVVRKINVSTGIITTGAGGGTLHPVDGVPAISVNLPFAETHILSNDSGDLYLSFSSDEVAVIYKVDARTGILSRVAGGEPGSSASVKLRSVTGMALDAAGNLYLADASSCAIRKVDAQGTMTTIAGKRYQQVFCRSAGDNGPASEAEFSNPFSPVIDKAGNLYVVDNDVIRKIDGRSGLVTTLDRDGNPAADSLVYPPDSARFMSINGLALDASGTLYIVDAGYSTVQRIDSSGPKPVAGVSSLLN